MKYLIAGLGNIGPEYAETRHNIGFMVADRLVDSHEASFSPARYGDKAVFRHKGRQFVVIKPSTYMNLSGRPVYYWLDKEKIDLQNLLVVTDDIALPVGTLRLRANGGGGGHNGLSNIIDVLGTSNFARLRIGIGSDFPKGYQASYVLGKWAPEEYQIVNPQLDIAVDIVKSFGLQGVERTMNLYNKRK
jgi:peptidyl-tRNA hydrolase, PTH1 family